MTGEPHFLSVPLHFPRRIRSCPSFLRQKGRSAVIRCLCIDEILIMVIEYLYGDGEGRSSVLSLALVARVFSVRSAEYLWKYLPSAAPLFSLLSSATTDVHLTNHMNYLPDHLVTDHDTAHHAFSRFHHYARMVRSLHWDNWDAPEWTERLALLAVNHWRDSARQGEFNNPLLPNLRSLYFREDSPEHFPAFLLFLGPKLSDLHIQSEAPRSTQSSRNIVEVSTVLYKAAVQKSLQLHSLSVRIPYTFAPAQLDSRTNQTLGDLQQLYNLAHKSWAAVLPFVLAVSPALPRIDVDVGSPTHFLVQPVLGLSIARSLTSLTLLLNSTFPTGPVVLPFLASLEVSFFWIYTDSVIFMRKLSCPRLKRLGISIGRSPRILSEGEDAGKVVVMPADDNSWQLPVNVYLYGICLADYYHTVTEFDVTLWTQHYDYPFTYLLRDQELFLETIYHNRFPYLKALSINVDQYIISRYMLTRQIVPSYPDLEELKIVQPYIYDRYGRVDLEHLPDVLPQLACLRALTLRVTMPAPYEVPELLKTLRKRNQPCTSLRSWNVLDKVITRCFTQNDRAWERYTKDVADAIRLVFPELQRITYSRTSPNSENWDAVNHHLRENYHSKTDILHRAMNALCH